MRARRGWLLVIYTVLLLGAAMAMAAEAGGGETADPASPWIALIPLVVPVLLAVLRVLAPKIPKVLLPILAPLLGAGADIALHYAGVSTMGVVWGAVLGSAGVGLRELADQIRKQLVALTT